MKIECPVCSMQIEITKAHVGRKGRCSRCESKFIIPAQPDDEFEILHRGKMPEDEKEKSKDKKEKEKDAAEKDPKTDSEKKRERSLVVPGEGQAPRRRASLRPSLRQNKSPVGLILMTAACAALAVGLLVLKNHNDAADAKKAAGRSGLPQPSTAGTDEPGAAEPIGALPGASPRTDPVVAAVTPAVEPSPAPKEDVAPALPVEEKPPPLTAEQKASALTFLKSNLPNKRKSAYIAFRKLGDHEKSSYFELLEEARVHHSNLLGERVFQLAIEDTPLSKFGEDYDAWLSASETAKKLVQTNWDKDKKKHAEMDKAFELAAKNYTKAMRSAGRARDFEPSGLQQFADILAEIRVEIAWSQDEATPGPLTLREEISRATGADRYIEILENVAKADDVATRHEVADQHNDGSGWAGGAYKTFANNLNQRRVAIGLRPLQLDEMLSKACRDHSADMAANGYFSHTGLTAETKSFGKRAKRAGFSGFATGECIFMGNPSPGAAHQAWRCSSDGHRLIMYANNPNTLGLGLHGKHWTLNTGKK